MSLLLALFPVGGLAAAAALYLRLSTEVRGKSREVHSPCLGLAWKGGGAKNREPSHQIYMSNTAKNKYFFEKSGADWKIKNWQTITRDSVCVCK